jgi:hypothetical protein
MNIAVSPRATAPTVTTKHLAYALAEQHQLSKKQSLEMIRADKARKLFVQLAQISSRPVLPC